MTPRSAPLGAHTSAAGGPWNALQEGIEIGATTIQFFTANQRRWHTRPLTQDAIIRFREEYGKSAMRELMSHGSYLINLGSPQAENLTKSRMAFAQEIERCQALGVSYLNFHPGAALHSTREECLNTIIESLLTFTPLLEQEGSPKLLLEMTAGQGSTIGVSFEEIAYMIQHTHHKIPIGVCIDTCHLFAAGYDIRRSEAWEITLDQFDEIVGKEHLVAFHLNDSKHGLGEHKDRHAPLGEGEIGLDCFRYLMQSPRTKHLPKYLETPGGPSLWREEIARLQSYTINN